MDGDGIRILTLYSSPWKGEGIKKTMRKNLLNDSCSSLFRAGVGMTIQIE